jgi:hypothetical protein
MSFSNSSISNQNFPHVINLYLRPQDSESPLQNSSDLTSSQLLDGDLTQAEGSTFSRSPSSSRFGSDEGFSVIEQERNASDNSLTLVNLNLHQAMQEQKALLLEIQTNCKDQLEKIRKDHQMQIEEVQKIHFTQITQLQQQMQIEEVQKIHFTQITQLQQQLEMISFQNRSFKGSQSQLDVKKTINSPQSLNRSCSNLSSTSAFTHSSFNSDEETLLAEHELESMANFLVENTLDENKKSNGVKRQNSIKDLGSLNSILSNSQSSELKDQDHKDEKIQVLAQNVLNNESSPSILLEINSSNIDQPLQPIDQPSHLVIWVRDYATAIGNLPGATIALSVVSTFGWLAILL